MKLRLAGCEYDVIQAITVGESLARRASLRLGDMIIWRGKPERFTSMSQIIRFYAAHDIELWSDWQWE